MKKILVIEDNTDVRENLVEILLLSGYEALSAAHGKEGVEQARAHRPDLILCDVMMPELDGFGVLRILGKYPETAEIPFVFLTAKTERSDFRKGMNLGADDYITKPFDDVELLDAIEMRLAKSVRKHSSAGYSAQHLDGFFRSLKGHEAFQGLSENREQRTYHKKDVIFEEGGHARQVFYVNSGHVKLSKTNEYGKELIIEMLAAGSFFGYIPLIQDQPYTETATALDTCELSLIPKKDFTDLLYTDGNVAGQLIKMLANNVVDKESQLLHLAYSSVRKKLADTLLRLHTQFGTEGKHCISVRREDLGNMTGTAKETVIRTLSEFKDEGIIDINGSDITILKADRLRQLPY